MKTLLKNIKSLSGITKGQTCFKGKEMARMKAIENAFIVIENDTISSFGEMKDCPEGNFDETIDASNKFVLPAWCDSHTHIVFAGSRENEFVDRIKGLTYQEIAAKGGGILNSAKRLQNTSEEELIKPALERINEIISYGTGAVEIKSGYGLNIDAEIKMLRVIQKLKKLTDITIKATFLGAHAVPAEFKNDKSKYIDLIIHKMLPIIANENLADYIDVFCEKNYFSSDETDKILQAGIQYGLKPKVHVNQFNSIGGVETCVKNNAISVDHLEVMTDHDIEILSNSNTIPTLLPSCSFFLGIPYGPAKKLIENNLPIALATDYNPGSTPSGNVQFLISLACLKMNLLPEEAINAVTLNGANAMELSKTHGSIEVGKKANLILTKEIPNLSFIPYSFGSNLVDRVILNGKIQKKMK